QWRCDCVLHWLRAWIIQEGHRLLLGKRILCAEPPRLAGQSLLDIPGNSLVCIPPAVRLDRGEGLVVSRPGDDLRVVCRASGYPQPAVGWRKVGGGGGGAAVGGLRAGAGSVGGAWGAGAWASGDPGTLTLRNLTASQAGRYECEARNPGGRAAAAFELSVNLSGSGGRGLGLGLGSLLPLPPGGRRPGPGLSQEPLYESVDSLDFTALGTATQTGIAAGISLLALTALLLLAVICRRRGKRGEVRGEEAEERAAGMAEEEEQRGLYLHDYSDGPTTFAQLEEYGDAAGHQMLVLDRTKRDFRTYKDTETETAAELGRLLQAGPLQDQATQTAEAEEEAEAHGEVLGNRGAGFQQEIKYEIHC
ncbi:leucine-rich repeat-containing protein 24, partial [Carcharodon carcharias]|uniref:leucine-rich repeat-containing protein 24 n=1 Tax=Carcharodon carcharias TaxID=13397 RepID=UPI001B7EE31D